LKDNDGVNSSTYTDNVNFSSYDEATVHFSYYPEKFLSGERFVLEVSTNGGSAYTTVEEWIYSTDFQNDIRYNATFTIDNLTLTSNTRFRIRAIAPDDGEIYLDDIRIEGCDALPTCTPGTACDDGDACTTGDTYDSGCNCIGTFQDADSDGVCDANDQCPGQDDALIGTACNDGDACTINDVYDANCGCSGTYVDSDNDGICDANDSCPTLANNLIGTACDDGLACTTNDTWDANCNCTGTMVDTDNDGVCDAEDQCPGQDDALIGTSCNDGDACTINDVYDANCGCAGTYVDADGDGYCLGIDPDDNDGCVPNANSSACNPCTVLSTDGFESNFGSWADGGKKAERRNENANTGIYSVRLRDDNGPESSIYSASNLALAAYGYTTIDFSYYTVSMDTGEEFFLEVSTNGGNSYSIYKAWASGTDYQNETRYNETVTITGVSFTNSTRFRFRSNGNKGDDEVFLDDIVVSACAPLQGARVSNPSITVIEKALPELSLFPNPTSSQVTVEYKVVDAEQVEIILTDFTGRIINRVKAPGGANQHQFDVSQLPAGYYLVHLTSGKQRISKKLSIVK
jgi:hypothetical protein